MPADTTSLCDNCRSRIAPIYLRFVDIASCVHLLRDTEESPVPLFNVRVSARDQLFYARLSVYGSRISSSGRTVSTLLLRCYDSRPLEDTSDEDTSDEDTSDGDTSDEEDTQGLSWSNINTTSINASS
jgi:hypothetical protein